MRLLMILVVAGLLLAGCSNKSDSTVAGPAPPGTAAPSGVPPSGANNGANLLVATPRQVPISWSDSLGAFVCAPSGPDSCTGAGTMSGGFHTFAISHSISFNGTVTLTWATDNPTMKTLGISFGQYKSCGNNCVQGFNATWASGSSPLSVTMPLSAAPSESLGVYVAISVPRATPSPILAEAITPADFTVAGTVTAVSLK